MPHNDYDWSTQIDDGWTSSMNDDKYISSMSVIIIIISNVNFFSSITWDADDFHDCLQPNK